MGYYRLCPLESSVELMMLGLMTVSKTDTQIAFSLYNKIVSNTQTQAHTSMNTHTVNAVFYKWHEPVGLSIVCEYKLPDFLKCF